MLPPTDYPQDLVTEREMNESAQIDLTYAALLDRAATEQPITDDMIRSACLKMEAAQQFPFAAKTDATERPIKQLLSKLRNVKKTSLLISSND